MTQVILWSLVGYCLLDFMLGMILGRCMVPGLKCRACKKYRSHR